MAVWMQIVGKKVWEDDLSKKIDMCKEILSDLELDLSFIKNTLEPPTFHKKLLPNYSQYDKSKWVIHSNEQSITISYHFSVDSDSRFDGLNIHLCKNLILMSGPFDHFQKWFIVTENKKLIKGYQRVVREVCKKFGVTQVVYLSEWCYSIEEFEKYEELELFLNEHLNLRVNQLYRMDGHHYYIKEIQA